VYYLLCGIVYNTCPKTCHKTYLFKAGSYRGVRHILFSLPEPLVSDYYYLFADEILFFVFATTT